MIPPRECSVTSTVTGPQLSATDGQLPARRRTDPTGHHGLQGCDQRSHLSVLHHLCSHITEPTQPVSYRFYRGGLQEPGLGGTASKKVAVGSLSIDWILPLLPAALLHSVGQDCTMLPGSVYQEGGQGSSFAPACNPCKLTASPGTAPLLRKAAPKPALSVRCIH